MFRRSDGEQGWFGPLPQLLSDVGVGLVVEHSGKVVLVNDRFCLLSGYAAGELLALQTFSRVFAPQERDVVAQGWANGPLAVTIPKPCRRRSCVPTEGRSPSQSACTDGGATAARRSLPCSAT